MEGNCNGNRRFTDHQRQGVCRFDHRIGTRGHWRHARGHQQRWFHRCLIHRHHPARCPGTSRGDHAASAQPGQPRATHRAQHGHCIPGHQPDRHRQPADPGCHGADHHGADPARAAGAVPGDGPRDPDGLRLPGRAGAADRPHDFRAQPGRIHGTDQAHDRAAQPGRSGADRRHDPARRPGRAVRWELAHRVAHVRGLDQGPDGCDAHRVQPAVPHPDDGHRDAAVALPGRRHRARSRGGDGHLHPVDVQAVGRGAPGGRCRMGRSGQPRAHLARRHRAGRHPQGPPSGIRQQRRGRARDRGDAGRDGAAQLAICRDHVGRVAPGHAVGRAVVSRLPDPDQRAGAAIRAVHSVGRDRVLQPAGPGIRGAPERLPRRSGGLRGQGAGGDVLHRPVPGRDRRHAGAGAGRPGQGVALQGPH